MHALMNHTLYFSIDIEKMKTVLDFDSKIATLLFENGEIFDETKYFRTIR